MSIPVSGVISLPESVIKIHYVSDTSLIPFQGLSLETTIMQIRKYKKKLRIKKKTAQTRGTKSKL